MATRTADIPAEARPRFRPPIGLLEIVTAIVFLGAGSAKLLGFPFMVSVFDALGAGPWFRFAVATMEIGGAIALLSSSYVAYAAIALLPIMLGAAITEIALLRRPPLAAFLCTVALVLIAWRHLPRPRAGLAPRP